MSSTQLLIFEFYVLLVRDKTKVWASLINALEILVFSFFILSRTIPIKLNIYYISQNHEHLHQNYLLKVR